MTEPSGYRQGAFARESLGSAAKTTRAGVSFFARLILLSSLPRQTCLLARLLARSCRALWSARWHALWSAPEALGPLYSSS